MVLLTRKAAMLVLTRRIGEEVVIAGNIRVNVLAVHGDRVRLGIAAPDEVCVDRLEVHERRSVMTSETHSVPRPASGPFSPAPTLPIRQA